MLGDRNAMATIAVRDFATARRFYEDVLGLKPEQVHEETGVGVFASGASKLVVYQSDTGGQNPATSATWGAGEALEDIVAQLQARGVKFERYDLPGAKMDGDIHVFDGFRAAWFRDPDGNILHVNSG